MKRALFIAGDRALTRSMAEALLGQSLEAPSGAPTPWRVARAHSALEARVLLEHGGRPFDAITVASRLPDDDGVALLAELRQHGATKEIPLFLAAERGQDVHSRRLLAARYRLAGLIEIPVVPSQVRAAFEGVRRRRRILVVDPRKEEAERYRAAFERGGFVAAVCAAPRQAREHRRRFDPDLAAVAVLPPDGSQPGGLEVCAALKQGDAAPPVLLYGPLSALGSGIEDNRMRADDFVKAPFDDDLLVLRAAALVGLGTPGGPKAPGAALDEADEPIGDDTSVVPEVAKPSTRVSLLDLPPLARAEAISSRPRAFRRTHRRVPCDVVVTVIAEGRSLRTATLDISHGGLFFGLDPPCPVGTGLALELGLPDGGPAVRAEGRVAWVNSAAGAGAGIGVSFTAIERRDLDRVVAYVNQIAGILYEA